MSIDDKVDDEFGSSLGCCTWEVAGDVVLPYMVLQKEQRDGWQQGRRTARSEHARAHNVQAETRIRCEPRRCAAIRTSALSAGVAQDDRLQSPPDEEPGQGLTLIIS